MERKSYESMHCSLAQCLEVVGDPWTLLIVRDAMLGVTRFDEFQRRLGISRNTLNQRLGRLLAADVLKKVPYSEGPPRFDYKLTERGRDLWPMIDAARQWGDKHEAPDGPPVEIVHHGCGRRTTPTLVCSECGEEVGVYDVTAVPGPGEVERLVRTA